MLHIIFRRKSSDEMNNAVDLPMGTTPNIYEVGADSSRQVVNGSPPVESSDLVVEPPPPYMDVSIASDPPVYAVIRKNRAGNVVDQSEASAPAGNTAAGDDSTSPVITNAADDGGAQPSAPPLRSSLYQDTTLIDNDLYSQDA